MSREHTGPGHRSGDDGAEGIDAQFAAMMESVQLPEDLRAGLSAFDGGDDPGAAGDSPGQGEGEAPRSNGQDPARNTSGAPHGGEVPDDASALAGEDVTATAKAVKVAVILTPLASAPALAALCRMSDLDCTVVPAGSGAFAVREFVSAHSEWDMSELLGGVETEPAEAAQLAGALSRLSRAGVVLLTADLATDVGIESGLSGTITARHYSNGQAGEEASAGLVLAAVDQVVEDVLLGAVQAAEVPQAIETRQVRLGRATKWLRRGLFGSGGKQG